MSYYKKITDKNVIIKNQTYVVGEGFKGKEESFLKEVEKTSLQEIEEKIKKKEQEMLIELEEKKKMYETEMYEEIYRKAYQEAKEKILSDFVNEREEINREYQDLKEYREKIINEELKKREELKSESEEQILEIALVLTKKIVSENIKNEKEIYEEYLQKIIDEVSDGNKKIYITMNPKAYRKIEPEIYKNVEILLDNTLEYEDIKVETEKEIIDLTLEERINQWRKILSEV